MIPYTDKSENSNKRLEMLIKAYTDESGNSEIRLAIVNSIISMGESAVMPLIQLLTEKSDATQYFAAYILAKIGDKRAIEPLINLLLTTINEAEINDEIEPFAGGLSSKILDISTLLSEFVDTRVAKPLLEAFRLFQGTGGGIFFEAFTKLGELAQSDITNALNQGDKWLHLTALKALGCIINWDESEKQLPLITLVLESPYSDLRLRAIKALEKDGGIEVLPQLTYISEHDKGVAKNGETIHSVAIKAIESIKHKYNS